MLYAATAWWSTASPGDRQKQEAVQGHAACVIAGMPVGAHHTDVLKEARLLPLDTVVMSRCIRYYLQAKVRGGSMATIADRMFPASHPLRTELDVISRSYKTVDSFGALHSHSVLRAARTVYFNCRLPGGLNADAHFDEKKTACMERVALFRHAAFTLWTDGSTHLDEKAGGGAILYKGDVEVARAMAAAGEMACSYRAECVAMETGLQLLLERLLAGRCCRVIGVFTDSLSLLSALNAGPLRVREGILRRIWTLILALVRAKVRLSFQFVFGHCGVPGTEAVYTVANAAADLPQDATAWITDMVTTIRCRRTRGILAQADPVPTYRQLLLRPNPMSSRSVKLTRFGEAVAARFRCNVSVHFGWFHRIVSGTSCTSCRFCGATALQRLPLYDDGASSHSISPGVSPLPEPEPPPDMSDEDADDGGFSSLEVAPAPETAEPEAVPVPRAVRACDPAFCPLCWHKYANRGTLVTHMRKSHNFTRARALPLARNAVLVPYAGLPIHCPHERCSYSTSVPAEYTGHMSQTHSSQPVPQLPAAAPRRAPRVSSSATARLPVLTPEPHVSRRRLELRCPRCGVLYHEQHRLDSHRCAVQPRPDTALPCTFVDAAHTLLQCPYCVNQLSVSQFRQHVRRVHEGYPMPVIPQVEGTVAHPELQRIGDTRRLRCCYCATDHDVRWVLRHIHGSHPGSVEPSFPPGFSNWHLAVQPRSAVPTSEPAPGRLRCTECRREYTRQGMTRHMHSAHPDVAFQLPPRTVEPERIRRRVDVVDPLTCQSCGRAFASADGLRNHTRRAHPIAAPAAPPAPTTSRLYRCAHCDRRLHSRPGLGYHVHHVHPQDTRGLYLARDGSEVPVYIAPKQRQCPRCRGQFADELPLLRHTALIHEHRVLPKSIPWFREEPHVETAEHLLVCPGLAAARSRFGIDRIRRKDLMRSDKLAEVLCEVLRLQSAVVSTPTGIDRAEPSSSSAMRGAQSREDVPSGRVVPVPSVSTSRDSHHPSPEPTGLGGSDPTGPQARATILSWYEDLQPTLNTPPAEIGLVP